MGEATGFLLSRACADGEHMDYGCTAVGKFYTRTGQQKTVSDAVGTRAFGYNETL